MIHPLRIAHRGASGLAPENTLTAFELAIQLGVDLIEVDVHGTVDGAVVVVHDSTLTRTTDRQGAVRELTLSQIRQADAGSRFQPPTKNELIPTLEEVLELTRNRAVLLIEIKADFLAERVLQIVESMEAESHVIIQSFNPETVHRVKLLNSSIPTALVVGKLPTTPSRVRARRMVGEVLEAGANVLSIWHAVLTPQFFEEVRRRGISVWTWTVDEQIIMRDLIQMGVQGIITNFPDRLNETLDVLESEGLLQVPLGRRRRRYRRRPHQVMRSSSRPSPIAAPFLARSVSSIPDPGRRR